MQSNPLLHTRGAMVPLHLRAIRGLESLSGRYQPTLAPPGFMELTNSAGLLRPKGLLI